MYLTLTIVSYTHPSPQVMAVNRSLVQQIDTLRLRLQVDTRHHDATRSALQHLNEEKLQEKDVRIDELKGELRHREQAVKTLTDENHKKRSEIQSLQHTINALKEDVEASKTYVEDIQESLHILQVIVNESVVSCETSEIVKLYITTLSRVDFKDQRGRHSGQPSQHPGYR